MAGGPKSSNQIRNQTKRATAAHLNIDMIFLFL